MLVHTIQAQQMERKDIIGGMRIDFKKMFDACFKVYGHHALPYQVRTAMTNQLQVLQTEVEKICTIHEKEETTE